MPSPPSPYTPRKRKRRSSIHAETSWGDVVGGNIERAASSSPKLPGERAVTQGNQPGAGAERSQPSPMIMEKMARSNADNLGSTHLVGSKGLDSAGSMSPRTVVAKQFENLALRGAITVPNFSLGKAGKSTGAASANAPPGMRRFVGLDGAEAETQPEDGGGKRQRKQTAIAEFSITGINPSRWNTTSLQGTAMGEENSSNEGSASKRPTPPRSIKSPPPSMFYKTSAPTSNPQSSVGNHSLTTSGSDFFDLTSLTWQDSEITGHLMLDSDDDGYGFNGIGFKPTAAMASARSLRRKQQVLAWRSREAKEERERRAEKRKRYADHLDMVTSGGQGVKKAVRFSV